MPHMVDVDVGSYRDGIQSEPSDPTTGAKMPKDDKIIVEELQTANNHLRGMDGGSHVFRP